MTVLQLASVSQRRARNNHRSPSSAGHAARLEAEVAVFPFSRRRDLVDRHARAMRALSGDAAQQYLVSVLEGLCAEIERLGLECDDCQCAEINGFAEAIGQRLHGPQFKLNLEEA